MGVLGILDHKYIHTYIYTYMHVYVYIYIYIYICTYIYIYRSAACTSSRELARSRGSRESVVGARHFNCAATESAGRAGPFARAGRFGPRESLQVSPAI